MREGSSIWVSGGRHPEGVGGRATEGVLSFRIIFVRTHQKSLKYCIFFSCQRDLFTISCSIVEIL